VRNDVPERYRMLGRSLFAASVIAVPLTASVTYAAADEPVDTAAPYVPGAAAEPPAVSERQGLIQATPSCVGAPCPERSARAHRTRSDESRPTPVSATEERLDAPEDMSDRADAISDAADAAADRAEALAERAEARAQEAQRVAEHAAEHVAARAMRNARELEARAPRVEQAWSAGGKIQTIRILSQADAGGARMLRKMVIDATCPADRPANGRSTITGETRVCTGTPDSARHVAIALRQARASVAASHLPAATRNEILAEFDQNIAEAQSTED
jgi:hypothetical protein